MHCLASWRLLEEHLSLGTDVLGIELLSLLVAQLQETLGAQLLLLLIYHVWNLQGCCSRTLGVWEHVELRNRQALQELIALLEALRSFTTTAHHHIYADKRIRHLLLNQVHLVGEERLVVTAVHQLKHLIASALQRNMEVRHEGTALGTVGDEVIIAEIRFQTGDTVTLDAFHLVHRLHKVEEPLMGGLSEITDVHTGNHDFLAALSCRLLALSHERLDAWVAGIATGERNGAIGAVVVATILHLQEVAGTVATGA